MLISSSTAPLTFVHNKRTLEDTMLKIVFKGTKTRLLLACFFAISITTGFILMLANAFLGRVFNDYILVQNFDGFAQLLFATIGMFIFVF